MQCSHNLLLYTVFKYSQNVNFIKNNGFKGAGQNFLIHVCLFRKLQVFLFIMQHFIAKSVALLTADVGVQVRVPAPLHNFMEIKEGQLSVTGESM